MSFFSCVCVSGITITVRNPSAEATTPSPMPVLPAVPSTIVPPLRSWPLATASWMIARAARSFTDPPGFMNSALPRIVQPVSSDARSSLMSGVWPIASTTEALNFITILVGGGKEPFHYARKTQIVYFAGAAASIPVRGRPENRREISLAKRFISLAN